MTALMDSRRGNYLAETLHDYAWDNHLKLDQRSSNGMNCTQTVIRLKCRRWRQSEAGNAMRCITELGFAKKTLSLPAPVANKSL